MGNSVNVQPVKYQYAKNGRYKYLGNYTWYDWRKPTTDLIPNKSLHQKLLIHLDEIPAGAKGWSGRKVFFYSGNKNIWYDRNCKEHSLDPSSITLDPLIPPIGITANNGRYIFQFRKDINRGENALAVSNIGDFGEENSEKLNVNFKYLGWYDRKKKEMIYGEGFTWLLKLDYPDKQLGSDTSEAICSSWKFGNFVETSAYYFDGTDFPKYIRKNQEKDKRKAEMEEFVSPFNSRLRMKSCTIVDWNSIYTL